MKPSEYEAVIRANTPERFPNLVCGWPDAELCLEWSDYHFWVERQIEVMEEWEDAPHLIGFRQWQDLFRNENCDGNDLGFSHEKCELCGALPGERYAVTALPVDPATNNDYVALAVCGDCLLYVSNGDLPEWLEEEA